MFILILMSIIIAAFVGILKLIWWVTKVWLKLSLAILEIVLVLVAAAIIFF